MEIEDNRHEESVSALEYSLKEQLFYWSFHNSKLTLVFTLDMAVLKNG